MKRVRSVKTFGWLSAASLVAVSSLGCGGGGDAQLSSVGVGDDPPALTSYLLFNRYDFNAGQANSIVVIPRNEPSAAGVTLIDNYDDLLVARRALSDAGGDMTGATEIAGMIFFQSAARGTGRWQRISFADTSLQSTPVSGETAAPCVNFSQQSRLIERQVRDERTFFVLYALPGADSKCFTDDDALKVIDYQADGSAEPVALNGVRAVSGAIYRADGQLDGLLALQGSNLVYISDLSAFGDRQVLATGVRSIGMLSVGGDDFHSVGQMFVAVQTADGNATIHRLGPGGQYSASLYTGASMFSTFASRADAQSLYVADQYFVTLPSTATEPVTRPLRLPLTGTLEAASVVHTFPGYLLRISGLTEHNVVFSGGDSNAIALDAIYLKFPAPADTLKQLDGFVSYASPSRLYIGGAAGSDTSGALIPVAIEEDENGEALATYAYGQWFGLRHPSARAFPQDQRRPVEGALLSQGQSDDGVRRKDATLYYGRLGQAPAPFLNADGSAFSVSYRDGIIFEDSGAATELAGFDDGDLSSINFELLALDFPNLHVSRITNTPDLDESPVY